MTDVATKTSEDAPEIRRLTFDLDVEVCVIGGGLAGLSVALEAAQMGASVAVLERHRVGWGASGHQLGAVMTGFDAEPEDVIARIGRRAAAELWRMSQTGAEMVRVTAAQMPGLATSDGALVVSASRLGDRALDRRRDLGADFGFDTEMWTADRVRDVLDTRYYFGGLHHRRAFQIDAAAYLRGLAARAQEAGVRIFEQSPVTALDLTGARKRITTPLARMRAGHVVLAGNVHLGTALPRLAATLVPVWRYGAVTAPLGERLVDAVAYPGSVIDTGGIDHFRIVDSDRLAWSGPQTTWEMPPRMFAKAIQRRIRTIFPALQAVPIAETFAGATGRTVHGMPQIGQLRPGLWVASGFGRHGLGTTAMAGRIIARGILWNDDRWRLFSPFDLIWAGGRVGRVAGSAIEWATRGRAKLAGAWARREETVERQAKARQARASALGVANSSVARAPTSQESERNFDHTG